MPQISIDLVQNGLADVEWMNKREKEVSYHQIMSVIKVNIRKAQEYVARHKEENLEVVYRGETVTSEQLTRFLPGGLMGSDNLSLFVQYCNIRHHTHFLSPYVVAKMQEDFKKRKKSVTNTLRSTRKVRVGIKIRIHLKHFVQMKITEREQVLLPLGDDLHWILIVFDLSRKRFSVFDSWKANYVAAKEAKHWRRSSYKEKIQVI